MLCYASGWKSFLLLLLLLLLYRYVSAARLTLHYAAAARVKEDNHFRKVIAMCKTTDKVDRTWRRNWRILPHSLSSSTNTCFSVHYSYCFFYCNIFFLSSWEWLCFCFVQNFCLFVYSFHIAYNRDVVRVVRNKSGRTGSTKAQRFSFPFLSANTLLLLLTFFFNAFKQ